MDIQPTTLNELLTSAMSVVAGIAGSWMVFRRRLSKDSVEMSKDRAEENTIKVLQNERDRAIEARERVISRLGIVDAEKAELTSKIQQLTLQVTHLNSQVEALRQLLVDVTKSLDESRIQMQEYMKHDIDITARLNIYEKLFPNEEFSNHS